MSSKSYFQLLLCSIFRRLPNFIVIYFPIPCCYYCFVALKSLFSIILGGFQERTMMNKCIQI
jgi:hypothetical protein